MKVIDLLNIWVNNRDKLPKKIKVDNKIFEYHEASNLYITPNDNYFLISLDFFLYMYLHIILQICLLF